MDSRGLTRWVQKIPGMLNFQDDLDSIEYPTSDGKPVGETDAHRDLIFELIESLKYHYVERPDVYVTGDLLLFYEEGEPKRFVVPDVMVIPGVIHKRRDHYKLWKEGAGPVCVIEVTSRSTRSEDLGFKKGLYEYLGVEEYLMVDPLKEYLNPSVRLFRRCGECLLPVVETPLRLLSLGLEVRLSEDGLRLWDPVKQELLPNLEEQRTLGARQKRRADREAKRAAAEAKRAAAEAARAEAESKRADAAEAELRHLRELLDRQS